MSKSGLYAHFKSKEALQLAAIETAVDMYARAIVKPALAVPPGLDRLLKLIDSFFDYIRSGAFPGGCFFVYTSLDPALRRPAIRARLAREQREWLDFIRQCVAGAIGSGELRPDTDPAALAFEIDSLLIGADANMVLLEDPAFLDHGRRSVYRLIGAARMDG